MFTVGQAPRRHGVCPLFFGAVGGSLALCRRSAEAHGCRRRGAHGPQAHAATVKIDNFGVPAGYSHCHSRHDGDLEKKRGRQPAPELATKKRDVHIGGAPHRRHLLPQPSRRQASTRISARSIRAMVGKIVVKPVGKSS